MVTVLLINSPVIVLGFATHVELDLYKGTALPADKSAISIALSTRAKPTIIAILAIGTNAVNGGAPKTDVAIAVAVPVISLSVNAYTKFDAKRIP